MPSTVADVFGAAGLEPNGVVAWKTPVREGGPGVYVVALTDDTTVSAEPASCAVSPSALSELLAVRRELRLDGKRPDAELLGRRLGAFWLADEVVLYIGLAGTSVRSRVGAYYRTPLGARRPHAGGWFLKTLAGLDGLFVHYAACARSADAEQRMLAAFSANVSTKSVERLRDGDVPIPFANLEWPPGRRKAHGITGARAPKGAGDQTAPQHPAQTRSAPGSPPSVPTSTSSPKLSQRVTAADLRGGRIRFPRPTKACFPAERAYVDVVLRGTPLNCRWDPRNGPDKERSGLLSVGREVLDGLVSADEVLRVCAGNGAIDLD